MGKDLLDKTSTRKVEGRSCVTPGNTPHFELLTGSFLSVSFCRCVSGIQAKNELSY